MKVFGIETSCDDTGVAIVNDQHTILSQALYTQREEHAQFQGVVPEIAARAHLNRLPDLCDKVLADAGLTLNDIDAFAATAGPGLIGGVMVGLVTGKTFAAMTGKPFIGINHLEAHILTPRLTFPELTFPFLVLLVSGGHTQIILAKAYRDYTLLGATRDDAAGEAFDKTAKLMGLGYPGGPALEVLARDVPDGAKAAADLGLPIPMLNAPHCDFSFSGLKTAMRNRMVKHGAATLPPAFAAQLASGLQYCIAQSLADRVRVALQHPECRKLNGIVVVGGVAANQTIRSALEDVATAHGTQLYAPPMSLCTDNGVMIAWAGVEAMRHGLIDTLDLAARPRWPVSELRRAV
ncbi:MAG: tRNA (adenosine(37)-N6)-threonylcarbamoyltransferase complex transferase subunit TsaD [Pseudomonadota bacterium]